MTNIRLAKVKDLQAIEKLHDKFYRDDFALPEFKNYLQTFMVEDQQGELVVFGGARLIVEVVALTDKSRAPRVKHDALYRLFNSIKEVSSVNHFDHLHVFTKDDPTWNKRLEKDGFVPSQGKCLVYPL